MPKSGIARAYRNSIFSFLRNLHAVFPEKAMAPHSSTLAWKIPWAEEPGRLQSMGSLRIEHDWATSLSLFTFIHWRRKWQPTPVFLPGESQGRGSLVGCCLWGRTELDTTEETQQQQQQQLFTQSSWSCHSLLWNMNHSRLPHYFFLNVNPIMSYSCLNPFGGSLCPPFHDLPS